MKIIYRTVTGYENSLERTLREAKKEYQELPSWVKKAIELYHEWPLPDRTVRPENPSVSNFQRGAEYERI